MRISSSINSAEFAVPPAKSVKGTRAEDAEDPCRGRLWVDSCRFLAAKRPTPFGASRQLPGIPAIVSFLNHNRHSALSAGTALHALELPLDRWLGEWASHAFAAVKDHTSSVQNKAGTF